MVIFLPFFLFSFSFSLLRTKFLLSDYPCVDMVPCHDEDISTPSLYPPHTVSTVDCTVYATSVCLYIRSSPIPLSPYLSFPSWSFPLELFFLSLSMDKTLLLTNLSRTHNHHLLGPIYFTTQLYCVQYELFLLIVCVNEQMNGNVLKISKGIEKV